ncbi:MAG: hypothetical protein K0U72_13110 [Gammaproteobacteria bacterium]|nr:hypothetical protein [Gammaproteobacteria bacterium]
MNKKSTITEQLRRNSVALISLAIAITSLGYNTWRNEASEHNRNQRLVTIELLLMLGDLQQITMDCHYGLSEEKDALLRAGWAKVLTIRDISQVASGGVPVMADSLYTVWNADREALGDDVNAKDRIITALENVRASTHEVLRGLD